MIPNVTTEYPIGKSTAAFLMSAAKLFHFGKVYFWTLTFVDVPRSDAWAMDSYERFMLALQKRYHRSICGLRVVELHKSHGIHFHMLTVTRIDINDVFAVGRPLGFGRTGVEVCSQETAFYLAKYLTKRDKRLPGSMRRWAAFGPWNAVKVRDLQLECDSADNLRKIMGGGRCDFRAAHLIFYYSNIFGPCENWTEKVKRRVFEVLRVAEWSAYEKHRLAKVFGWSESIDGRRPF